MKVCITNRRRNWADSQTGKGFFIQRLIKEFAMQGIEVTTDPDCKVEITLGVGKFEFPPQGKAILRLGDIHKDTNENYKLLNKRKVKALFKADGIIYQSKYSKKLAHHFLGKPKCPEIVIFNGADPKEFDVEPHKSEYRYNILASTRKWTRQKRIHQIWDAFLEANISDSCLWICGQMENKIRDIIIYDKNRAVHYLDIVSQERIKSLYRLCDVMVDLTWLSACPNSVVEALVAGCPVICTNQGGTHELLKYPQAEGIAIPALGIIEDKKYNYKPVNLYKPPKADIDRIAGAIKNYIKTGFPIEAEHLYISTIAKQYKAFFERILNG